MRATIIRRVSAIAVTLVLAVALAVPAAATAASAATADPVSPVGRYRLTTTTRKTHLIINADHTFQIIEFGDSGTWAQLGDVIALGLWSGSDIGCVMVGVVNTTGISGKGHPGNFSCGQSSVFPMYAVRLPPQGGAATVRRAGGSLRASLGRPAAPAVTSLDPTGSYTAIQNGQPTGFVVASDHNVTWADLGDSGTWAEFNDVAAFLVTSFTADRGCFSVGRVHTTSVNTPKAPGPTICPGDVQSSWFARRLPA
jgi:hypothetical protein